MKIPLVAFLLPVFVLLPVFPGGAVTIEPVYDSGERSAQTGFFDATPLTQEQKDQIGPSGNDAETLGEARRKALEYAFGLMEPKLAGDFTIRVEVSFSDALSRASAVARPCLFQSSHLPSRRAYYPRALAKALLLPDYEFLRRNDGPCGGLDMFITFNSGSWIRFYYGFDDIRALEFVTVVLHEFFHGLGFYNHVKQDGQWTHTRPTVYDEQLYSEADENFLHMLSPSQRAAAVVSGDGLSWYGKTAAGCSYGQLVGKRDKWDGTTSDGKPLLHAPSGFRRGSSVSHLHLSVEPDDILESRFSAGSRDMTLALALLKDIGWPINDPGIPSCASETPVAASADPAPPAPVPSAPADAPPPATDGAPDGTDLEPLPSEDGDGTGENPVGVPDGTDRQPLPPGDEGRVDAGVSDRQNSAGGCAVASDGDFRSENIFGGLFPLLSALVLTLCGKRRPGERRARSFVSGDGIGETSLVYGDSGAAWQSGETC